MKDIIESIKGALFEDQSEHDNTGAPTKPYVASQNVPKPVDLSSRTVAYDQSIMDTMQSRVYPSTGALSVFRTTLKSLESAIPDELTRLNAAVSVCTAQGAAINVILADIDTASARLTTEKQAIETARQGKYNVEVDIREKQAKELTSAIDAKAKEIASMTFTRDSIIADTEKAKTEIEARAKNYTAALSQIATDLDALTRKLKTSIGAK